MRRAGRRDRNHGSIRDDLRDLGFSVWDTGSLGDGAPDLVVGARGRNYLLEVKFPGDEDDLTPAERRFHEAWQGQIDVVSSLEMALEVIERDA